MEVSVVIPTCNRKQRLLSLLEDLNRSVYPLKEVIIVDSGEQQLDAAEYSRFGNLPVQVVRSEKSVCLQRNLGIGMAKGDWIFLCDDDMEVPPEYILKLALHSRLYPAVGAISGLVMQKLGNEWTADYPVRSVAMLYWSFFFKVSLWGKIQCNTGRGPGGRVVNYFSRKGNHISKAGWPVLTDFSGEFFITPLYGLGASLVRKEWLLLSPFDEVLDRYGIGDNYGVCLGFAGRNIHVVNDARVYHHHEQVNRLQRPLQYFRRALALDYFRLTGRTPGYVKKSWLLWSLSGNFFSFLFVRDHTMWRPALKTLWVILLGRNPYYRAAKEGRKVEEPLL